MKQCVDKGQQERLANFLQVQEDVLVVVVLVRDLCRPFAKCFCGALRGRATLAMIITPPASRNVLPPTSFHAILLTHNPIHHPTDTPSRPRNHDLTCLAWS